MFKKILKIGIPLVVLAAVLGFAAFCLPKLVADHFEPEHPSAGGTVHSTPDIPVNKAPKSKAQIQLERMSLEEKVGQMFFLRCLDTGNEALLEQYHPGGMLLFGRDFKDRSKEEAKTFIASLDAKTKIPLFVGVDEEGGAVNRISNYPQYRAVPFQSPQKLFKTGGWPLIESDTAEKCNLLRSLGVNVNFAPVCDVSTDPEDFIYDRTLGQDTAETRKYVTTVTETMNKKKVAAVLKHFPGYGSTEDTHTGMATDDRPLSEFAEKDLLPFKAGIDADAGFVLVSHNIVTAVDSKNPASLSPRMLKILRQEMGFTGVIITDALDMQAVLDFAGERSPSVLAVKAGADMLCCADVERDYPALLAAVQDGAISEKDIDASVLRILNLKERLGLLD